MGRRSYVGRHEARRRTAVRRTAAVVVAVAAVAAVALLTLGPTGPRVAEQARGRPPPPPGPNLIAAPGFGAGLEGWRAFPGTYVTKGRLGDPTAAYARVQRDPTVPAVRDRATRAAMVGLATRVRVSAPGRMPLRATVRVRASRSGTTVLVRLAERVGERRTGAGERRSRLAGTGWHQVATAHRVRRAGAAVYLEVWALALAPDEALFVGQAQVTSP